MNVITMAKHFAANVLAAHEVELVADAGKVSPEVAVQVQAGLDWIITWLRK